MTTIANNLQTVQQRLGDACAQAGRPSSAVELLAVSKTFGPEAVEQAAAAGQVAFGENYIQEAVEKIVTLQERGVAGLQWHCIGPVQSNKTRLVAEHFDWVHTVDRLKIAERLSAQRPEHLPPLQVCVQVNVSGEASKSGCTLAEAPALARAVARLPRLVLRGLMCIPDPAVPAEELARQFAGLQQIHARLEADGLMLDTLSMGMSADLESAIAHGSTCVRVGTAIFGARHYPVA